MSWKSKKTGIKSQERRNGIYYSEAASSSASPGSQWGDQPLLGPADGGWGDTVDLTGQDGVLPLGHRYPERLRGASSAFSAGSGTHWGHAQQRVKLTDQNPAWRTIAGVQACCFLRGGADHKP